jgi:hypothetical protein
MRLVDAGRPARRTTVLCCAAAVLAGLVLAGCGTARATGGSLSRSGSSGSGSSSRADSSSRPVPGMAVPSSAVRRLTALAHRIAKLNGDASPVWVSAVCTTRQKALTSATPGDIVPGDAGTIVYLLTLKGHFTDYGSTGPAGAKLPAGRYVSVVVNARTLGSLDYGISSRPPPVAPASLGPATYLIR